MSNKRASMVARASEVAVEEKKVEEKPELALIEEEGDMFKNVL